MLTSQLSSRYKLPALFTRLPDLWWYMLFSRRTLRKDQVAGTAGRSRRGRTLPRSFAAIGAGLQHLRTAWLMLGVTLLLIMGIEAACRAMVFARQEQQKGDGYEAAYADAEWLPEYRREFQDVSEVEWRSWIYWRRQPFTGTWINIDSKGLRRNWQPKVDNTDPLRILVFGGSTVWGTGARDEHTIPSYLAKSLDSRSIACQVVNCGETGYVARQELIMLTTMLQEGERPDIVVFYDGVNDVFSAFQNGAAGLPQNESNRRREFGLCRGFRPKFDPQLLLRWTLPGMQTVTSSVARRMQTVDEKKSEPDAELVRATCANYVAVVEMIGALESQYGFRSFHFWQPTLFDRDNPTEHEVDLTHDAPAGLEAFSSAVYSAIKNDVLLRDHPRFRDVSETFADDRDTIFIDDCHITEAANRKIAERMARDIAELAMQTSVARQD